MVQIKKKIALLHRHPASKIKETNAAFPYLIENDIDVLTFRNFNRSSRWDRFVKSFFWIFYSPFLVMGKGYDVIYCDDSYPFYPALVKLASPKSKIVLRIGDFHLMYYTKGLVYKILHILEKQVWKMADEIIAISAWMAIKISQDIQKFPAIVLDPVDPADFPLVNSRHKKTVMFHGTLTKNKNIDILIEAARKIPKVLFVIIGDGEDKDRLEAIAPYNVLFKGWVSHSSIYRFISTCSVGVALRGDNPGNDYVVTSPYLQYGIMGKPCLVTKRKVFGDYVWQFSNVDELVQLINILLDEPELAEHEGVKLRKNILENHDAKKIARQIWKILESV